MRLVIESVGWTKNSSFNKTLLASKINGCSMARISNNAEARSWQR